MENALTGISTLRVGVRIRGLVPNDTVTLIAVEPIDNDVCEIVYRDDRGRVGSHVVTDDDVVAFDVVGDVESAPAYDGDADEFRLAAEALRIKYAALYDPMAAVNSSHVDPLPHQIRAVYEEMLPRIPLRFLLADDPGAGKTIMAGLYLKELILRSDCDRAIIVAPGGLVEQWRDELSQKFDLRFEVFSKQMVDDAEGRNPFAAHPYLIARMDQLSRSEEFIEQLSEVSWDVAVVDEAHRMSAHYWAGEVDETKRFRLGRLLSQTAHHFLLMTATPHAGKEEDFQLFMSLLDPDRFEGQYRDGVHRTDTRGLMRRMVKEDLLTFEGKPLFPERRAYTVAYDLSPAEQELYEAVTDYVRTEMGRADRIAQDGDSRRGHNVGFALTVLQRRLASSPEAILRSLERRRTRLDARRREMIYHRDAEMCGGGAPSWASSLNDLPEFSLAEFDALDEETTEDERAQFEAQIDDVVDRATAARNIPELEHEIQILDDLVAVAQQVRYRDDDKKWVQLRAILDEQLLSGRNSTEPGKIIIFTEHRDTLGYLEEKITAWFGRSESVVTIHGGTSREARKQARERFTHDPLTVVLLATDAAGEGLNLQRAHLMVNYDLPWNPNRIEQRFGRVHRIGQKEVCHLWNLVAKDTREGDVFTRLLSKIEQMNRAYNGNLFNVLGEDGAFQEHSLRDLLLKAIRYGDDPHTKAQLNRIIDAGVSTGLRELTQERALHPEMFSSLTLSDVRALMERARERRLQPGYIAAFFIPAFERVGGRIRKRERGRYEITRVPPRLVAEARRLNRWSPVADRYERVTFDLSRVHPEGMIEAALVAPGHPLLDALLELTIKDLSPALKQGTVLVDHRSKQSHQPTLVYAVQQQIENSAGDIVSHHFDYVHIEASGVSTISSVQPYLDFDQPQEGELREAARVVHSEWARSSHEKDVRSHSYSEGTKPRLNEIKVRIAAETERTRNQVKQRLNAEINHWYSEHARLEAAERNGTTGRLRAETALVRAKELEDRLDRRLRQLDDATRLVTRPAVIRGVALVIPDASLNAVSSPFARNTQEVERRAVDAVLSAESALGRVPTEMAHNNPGYDVRSIDHDGAVFYIEVKGRIAGADTFTVTVNEVTFAQTQEDRYRLALVEVAATGADGDQLRYVTNAFSHIEPATSTKSLNEQWKDYWSRGGPPQ